MKTHIKTFAFVAVALLVFLACDDARDNNTEQEYKPDYPFISRDEIPAMDSRVVSYKRYQLPTYDYCGYGRIVTGKDTLEIMFPHIFNGRKNKSECNYFALCFSGSSSTLGWFYPILSEDMILSLIHCNSGGKSLNSTDDFANSAMLICDDKKGTLRESIDLDSTRNYIVPDWDCKSGKGKPREDVYF